MPARLEAGRAVTGDAFYPEESRPVAREPEEHPLRARTPVLTGVLLGAIVIVFVLETLFGGSTSIRTLIALGAQVNTLIGLGERWRLLSSMFLHIGVMHLMFNGWALFSLGREVESFYGTLRYAAIYLASGLFGGLASYVFGANVPSAGASGAIFGLIGAQIAFFARNRQSFGNVSRQQLGNLAGLVIVNLIFGFTVPGINNLAHMGGLAAGVLLGLGLSPTFVWQWSSPLEKPRLQRRQSFVLSVLTVLLAIAIFFGGLNAGDDRWAPAPSPTRSPTTALPQAGPVSGGCDAAAYDGASVCNRG